MRGMEITPEVAQAFLSTVIILVLMFVAMVFAALMAGLAARLFED